MTWTKLSYTDSGAPQLKCANGSLTAVLRWALPTLGWAVEFGPTGNAAVFRAATGNRFRLGINNNAAVSLAGGAYVRGAETATSATAWASLFPTSGQVSSGNSIWNCGYYGDTSLACPWYIYGNETFFYLITSQTGSGSDWELHYFGDVPTVYTTAHSTVMSVKNVSYGYTQNIAQQAATSYPSPNNITFFCRDVGGTVKSTKGDLYLSGSAINSVTSAPISRGGYQNKVYREKVGINCTGSASDTPGALAMVKRAWLPNLWSPVHSAGVSGISDLDTFTDTAYNPSAVFRVFVFGSQFFIIEETDTWSRP